MCILNDPMGVVRTLRHQQVEVVTAHKLLSKPHDSGLQALLAMMVGCMLGHIARELCNLFHHPSRAQCR